MSVLAVLFLVLAQTASPQAVTFKARLSPVPVESNNAARITGTGTVTAVLDGSKLTIDGTFEGMKSAATIAQVHMGQRGVRGPVEFDLQIDRAPNGHINGTITLTKVRIDTLRKGWYYIQIHAEQAPDGNLWGWLLPTGS